MKHSGMNEWMNEWMVLGRALDIFWECASKNLRWSHLCECMVCAAPKCLLHTACAVEPRHIVAGVRFHWSREERRFQHERFVGRAWFTPVSHRKREWRRSGAYAEREQRVPIVLSYWQRLSRAAEPRLILQYRRVSSFLSYFPAFSSEHCLLCALMCDMVSQGSRLILPTGRTCATNFLSWSHEYIIWSQFFLMQHLINQCMLMNFYQSIYR